MKKWLPMLLFLTITINPVQAQSPENIPTPSFSDTSKHWANAAIEAAVAKGYVKGYPDGTFRPDNPVTVAEFTKMLLLSLSEEKEDGSRTWSKQWLDLIFAPNISILPKFDFKQGDPWYKPFTVTAVQMMLYNQWHFKDHYNDPLQRKQAAYIVNELVNYEDLGVDNKYAEVALAQIKDYKSFGEYRMEVSKAMIRGTFTGYMDGTFKGDRFITRAESITIIDRATNPSLRKPMVVNLKGQPYSIVKVDTGAPDHLVVFSTLEMKKVFDQMVLDLKKVNGVSYAEFYGAFTYYENKEMKEKDLKDSANLVTYDPSYDTMLGLTDRGYFMNISKKDGRYERQRDTVERFVTSIMGKDAPKMMKMLDDAVANERKDPINDIRTTINHRAIIIYSVPGSTILGVNISAYADR